MTHSMAVSRFASHWYTEGGSMNVSLSL